MVHFFYTITFNFKCISERPEEEGISKVGSLPRTQKPEVMLAQVRYCNISKCLHRKKK